LFAAVAEVGEFQTAPLEAGSGRAEGRHHLCGPVNRRRASAGCLLVLFARSATGSGVPDWGFEQRPMSFGISVGLLVEALSARFARRLFDRRDPVS
jgi:hypothetical protein